MKKICVLLFFPTICNAQRFMCNFDLGISQSNQYKFTEQNLMCSGGATFETGSAESNISFVADLQGVYDAAIYFQPQIGIKLGSQYYNVQALAGTSIMYKGYIYKSYGARFQIAFLNVRINQIGKNVTEFSIGFRGNIND